MDSCSAKVKNNELIMVTRPNNSNKYSMIMLIL